MNTATLSTKSSSLVGTQGSFSVGSDTYPCTVVESSPSGHRLVVEQDWFMAGPGHDYYGNQNWKCHRREGGPRMTFTRRQDGTYREIGGRIRLSLDGWAAHQDPCF